MRLFGAGFGKNDPNVLEITKAALRAEGGLGTLPYLHLGICQELIKRRLLPAPHPTESHRAALERGQEICFHTLPGLSWPRDSETVGGAEGLEDHT